MKSRFRLVLFAAAAFAAALLWGCSMGKDGLLSITPEQYLFSAIESLESIDERDYEVRDLDEIIRILENAEKNAKKSETIDKSRICLVLAHTLKARKQYQTALMKGEYLAGKAEPFYVLNTKDIKETLRKAKKWLRKCESVFKTSSLRPDLNFVKGMYYTQKMLTQQGGEKNASLQEAVLALRRCMGLNPAFEASFKLFGRKQTAREARLKLIEAMALGKIQSDAYGLVAETQFADIIPVSGATPQGDFAWHQEKGLVLAIMGKYKEAVQDYPTVDEALWLLEGVFDRMAEAYKDKRFELEAKIVASMLNKLEGPYSSVQYSTAAHLFPKLLCGDLSFFDGAIKFYEGDFKEAVKILEPLRKNSLVSLENRSSLRLMLVEAKLYGEKEISDDSLEELLDIAENSRLTPMQKERAGYLLARYVMQSDEAFSKRPINHSGHDFIRSITQKPWALSFNCRRGAVKRAAEPIKNRDFKKQDEDETIRREPGEITLELYANKPDDWVVSANMYIIKLPEMYLASKGRIVGREEASDSSWHFKAEQINSLKRSSSYLALFEYDNSDSDKNVQGIIFKPR